MDIFMYYFFSNTVHTARNIDLRGARH